MNQTMFKIMLLFTIIFMSIEMAGAVSYNQASDGMKTSSAVSAQTEADETLDFIHATLDKTHDLFSRRSQDNSFSRLLDKRVMRNDRQNINFSLRLLLFYHSLREVCLLKNKECLYPSTNTHRVLPSCEYYVFAMREIII